MQKIRWVSCRCRWVFTEYHRPGPFFSCRLVSLSLDSVFVSARQTEDSQSAQGSVDAVDEDDLTSVKPRSPTPESAASVKPESVPATPEPRSEARCDKDVKHDEYPERSYDEEYPAEEVKESEVAVDYRSCRGYLSKKKKKDKKAYGGNYTLSTEEPACEVQEALGQW